MGKSFSPRPRSHWLARCVDCKRTVITVRRTPWARHLGHQGDDGRYRCGRCHLARLDARDQIKRKKEKDRCD